MTNRFNPAASAEARAAAEDARRLLARAGKARDEDQDDTEGKKTALELATSDRDDETEDAILDALDDEERDDEEGDEDQDEEAAKRAGRGGKRAAIRAAVEADRERAAKILELARAAGLPNFGRRHVEYGTSVREFRQALKERQGKPGARALREQPSFTNEVSRGAQEAKRTLGRK